jgi:hypothetical protein
VIQSMSDHRPTSHQHPTRDPARDQDVQRRPRPRKHLMVPGQQRPQNPEPMSLSQVQRWVLSTLAVITIEHLAAGLVIAALFMPADRLDSTIALLVIAGLFGMVAVATALLIHRRRPLSPWLLLGTLPAVVGAYLAFLA